MLDSLLRFYKMLGIIFLALLVGAVYLTYAIFTKQFTDYDKVTLDTSTIGLQLPKRADVKVRGVIVGEVLNYDATADGATVELGIYPSQIDNIPANVTGSILPKTLFGEKYVALDIPQQPVGQLKAGMTIDRTHVSTEVEKVLSDLYPLLRTVRPAQLKGTLDAISTALEGRGNELGQSLETTDAYLKRLNPKIPQLVEDLRKTASVADIYSSILPNVADILDDTRTTTETLQQREDKVRQLFTDVASFSDTTRTFLADNENNLVNVAKLSARQLRVLARYSTEFPCLTGGIVKGGKLFAEAFRGFELHIILETIPRQPRAYTADDLPRYGETRGPNCLHLPNPPWSQDNPVKRVPNFDDGVDTPTGKGTDRVAPGFAGTTRDYSSTGFTSGSAGYAGSVEEDHLYRQLLAPGLGVQPSQVSDLGTLLAAPMARGAKVTLR